MNREIDMEILYDIITDHKLCPAQKEELEKAINILSQQKESKGSVIIALSEGEYIHRCLNCNNQIMSISGSLNFCPTCGKEVEPLHMASGEIVFSETN